MKKLRILFVDDEVHAFRVWGEPLQLDLEHDVVYAPTPKEALEKLVEERYDVVIIDRIMIDLETGEESEEAGDKLLEFITARWNHVCPIMFTNLNDLDAVMRATRHGAFRYLVKGSVSAKELGKICVQGAAWQRVKQERSCLLTLTSVPETVAEVIRIMNQILTVPFCCQYLQVAPQGSLVCERVGGSDCPESDPERRFVESRSCTDEVVKNGRPLLLTRGAQPPAFVKRFEDVAGSRLILPVFAPFDPSRTARKVAGLLWLESREDHAFDRNDMETLSMLADCVSDAVARTRQLDKRTRVAGDEERAGALQEFSHRICNTLQRAQSDVDLLTGILTKNSICKAEDLKKHVKDLQRCLDETAQEADRLREREDTEPATTETVDLRVLLADRVDAFRHRVETLGGTIHLEAADRMPVRIVPNQMNYALDCLLQNAVDALETPEVSERAKEIRITANIDPSGELAVLLTITDSGCGIYPQNRLDHVFNRYFTTKSQDPRRGKRGLGLAHVKRIIEEVSGSVEAMNAPKGGLEISILLPICSDA